MGLKAYSLMCTDQCSNVEKRLNGAMSMSDDFIFECHHKITYRKKGQPVTLKGKAHVWARKGATPVCQH